MYKHGVLKGKLYRDLAAEIVLDDRRQQQRLQGDLDSKMREAAGKGETPAKSEAAIIGDM